MHRLPQPFNKCVLIFTPTIHTFVFILLVLTNANKLIVNTSNIQIVEFDVYSKMQHFEN